MKKFLLSAALLAGTATASMAQSNTFKVNILSPLVRTGSFFYEHKLNEQSSIQLGGLFTNWSGGDTKITGFAFTPEYRFYLSDEKKALRGFYVGPYLRYQNLTLSVDETYTDGNGNQVKGGGKAALNTFGGGVVVGHQWIFKQRFSLDLFLGPSFNDGSIKVTERSTGYSESFDAGPFTGFGLRSGVTFGLAF
jgi:hypothetical protein